MQAGNKNGMYGKTPWNKGKKYTGKTSPNKGKFGKDNSKYGKGKHVYQIDKYNGTIIKEWGCIKEVERALGIFQSSIVACCKGRLKTAGGFIWQYVD